MVAPAAAPLGGAMDAADRADAMPWHELVRAVHRQMRSLVGVGHRELEDLTQAALEQVLRGLPRFEGRAEVTTFTYRICAHVAMSHWRGWRRWAKRFQFWTEPAPEPLSAADGSSALLERERARVLHACLGKLSAMKRICVTLADLEELPASRIAEILECPEPTVRSRLRAARQELAELLRNDPLFGRDDDEEVGHA